MNSEDKLPILMIKSSLGGIYPIYPAYPARRRRILLILLSRCRLQYMSHASFLRLIPISEG